MDFDSERLDGGSPKLYRANNDIENNNLFGPHIDIEVPSFRPLDFGDELDSSGSLLTQEQQTTYDLGSRLPFQSPERESSSDPVIKSEAEYVGFGSNWRPYSGIIELSDTETEKLPELKPEPSSSSRTWVDMPNQIDLTGFDNEYAATAQIKQENTATGFDWTIMPKSIDLVSDGELETLEAHDNGLNIGARQMSTIGKNLLSRRSKINTYRTPEHEAKLEQLQKKLAEKARKNAIAAGASSIFNGSAGQGNANQGVPIDVDTDSDPDVQAAIGFQRQKKIYYNKCRSKSNTFEDDIMWSKAQNAELARIKRAKDELRNNTQDSDDELFISQASPSMHQGRQPSELVSGEDQAQYSRKARRARVNKDDDIDVVDVQSSSDTEELTQDKMPNKRAQQKQIQRDEHASMRAGLENFLQKEANQENKKRKRHSGSSSHPRKRKDKNKAKDQSKKPKPTEAGYLLNSGSLMTSTSIYEDANSNLARPLAPEITETKKQEALKKLLVNVPMEDLRQARSEKAHLLRSTKILGKNGRCKFEGNNWRLKGMSTTLYHYQVQGAAWMKERETGTVQPFGGLLADQMGLGKTIMLLACMVANQPTRVSSVKTTLIVCTASLARQWQQEIVQHTEPSIFPYVIRYHTGSKIKGPGAICALLAADIVITTYDEVRMSYPKFKPPGHLVQPAQIREWWESYYMKERGLLHQVHWYRIILDEAQAIKNRDSQTSIACRGLISKLRWAVSATPIQNNVEELYPFFKLLRVKHTGTFETFKENFCDTENQDSTMRLHAFLRQFMIRRTHSDLLFGRPLLLLPKNSQRTIPVEFNEVERALYEAVRNRFLQKITKFDKAGALAKNYRNILHMLLRLRQLTAHPFMLQSTIEDILEGEDIEKLMSLTVSDGNEGPKDMLAVMKKMIRAKTAPVEPEIISDATPSESQVVEDDNMTDVAESERLVFNFRRFLQALARSDKWDDLKLRTTCRRCEDCPEEPYVIDCYHLYCKDCLLAMQSEAGFNQEGGVRCLECGFVWTESRPCTGLQELEFDPASSDYDCDAQRSRKDKDEDLKWIDYGGQILPSSKTAAVQAQIEEWLATDPEKKIIVFSQFHTMMKVMGRMFSQKGWDYVNYNGSMSQASREQALIQFKDSPETMIMIASLKCGGVGLNLTMASRVISVDLWWNNYVEQQAFCRVFRIGQEHETTISRITVKNTVDEALLRIQEIKEKAIGEAMDGLKMLEKLSFSELLDLFGPVQEGENRKEFVLVDDDGVFDNEIPPIATAELQKAGVDAI
ncbi:MAG: hypothetical protein Q9167_004539 [Letrouitia subvulpina]